MAGAAAVDGWLLVSDPLALDSSTTEHVEEEDLWVHRFCVVMETAMYICEDEENASKLSETLQTEEEEGASLPKAVLLSPDKQHLHESPVRRSSAPPTPTGPIMEGSSTPSKFAALLPKRLKSGIKRTKSVTKLDRKASVKAPRTQDRDAFIVSRLKTSRSHESLLSSPSHAVESLDLAGEDVQINPIHSSILGQDHCFQVTSASGSRCFACKTAAEKERWIENIRKTVQPTREKCRRTDNTLKLWIIEAKGLSVKKRYFCELLLDEILYARTSSKQKSDVLFWGEHFHFSELPAVQNITVNLYKDADKKKKKEKTNLIGTVNIAVNTVDTRQFVEKWYPLVVPNNNKSSKTDNPSIRIKARFQSTPILPLELYREFTQYINDNYSTLCKVLEPVVGVKNKEEIASTMVHILQSTGRAREFLTDIIMTEVSNLADQSLIFRGNTLATKAMEAYLKLVGGKYLQETLGEFIRALYESDEDCEVEPSKVASNVLSQHQQALRRHCELAWCKVINSYIIFPSDLKEIFSNLRNRTADKGEDFANTLISGCIFLRFLCPAILSPSLFFLTQEYPSEKTSRCLTLIAKTTQSLANFTKFGNKEEYMSFMNEFVEGEMLNMRNFLKQISSPGVEGHQSRFSGFIDLGRELSVLHSLITECLTSVDEASLAKLGNLPNILQDITAALKNPTPLREQVRKNYERFSSTPNFHMGSVPHNLSRIFEDADLSSVGENAAQPTPRMIHKPPAGSVIVNPGAQNSSTGSPLLNGRSGSPLARLQTNENGDKEAGKGPISIGSLSSIRSSGRRCPSPGRSGGQSGGTIANGHVTTGSQVGNGGIPRPNNLPLGPLSFSNPVYQYPTSPVQQQATPTSMDYTSSDSLSSVNSSIHSSNLSSNDEDSSDASTPVNSIKMLHNRTGSPQSRSRLKGPGNPKQDYFARNDHSRRMEELAQRLHEQRPRANFSPRTQRSQKASNSPLVEKRDLTVSPPPLPPPIKESSMEFSSAKESSVSSGASRRDYGGYASSSTPSSPMNDLTSPSCVTTPSPLSPSSGRPSPLLATVESRVLPSLHQSAMVRVSHGPPHERTVHEYAMRQSPLEQSLSRGDSSRGPAVPNPAAPTPPPRAESLSAFGMTRVESRKATHSPVPRLTPTPAPRVLPSSNSTDKEASGKADEQHEAEIAQLKMRLLAAEAQTAEVERRREEDKEKYEQDLAAWKKKMVEGEERLKGQQEDKDAQMKNIITRLMSVEEELRKEHQEMQHLVDAKQRVIEAQEKRIQSLDAANARLLTALNQLKEKYHHHMKNAANNTKPSAKLSVTENGEFKNSSC
ncbi:ras GTPase-activating protein nGAP-like isoform X2 [Branchiostoma lanceolatum]|uniref:ras GTPase-activating protein nGAP-like isoform X2 n=1 Tax=Branchiostoma lanceolatum TaxID=7740 RepID=UPI003453B308